jgi:hypothetical protein
MNFSTSIANAVLLVASYIVLTAMPGAPASAAEPILDARILSATPFRFHDDQAIISMAPETPSDSGVFLTPRKPAPFIDDSPFSQPRSVRLMLT